MQGSIITVVRSSVTTKKNRSEDQNNTETRLLDEFKLFC